MARLPRNSIRLSPQYPTPHRFVGYPNDYSYLIMLFSLVNSILSSIQTLIMFLAFRTLMAHFEPTETHVKYLAAPTDVSPYKMSITSGVVSIILGILAYHVIQVHRYRFKNLHDLKKRHGFTSDPSTYLNMTVEQAQEVYKNLAMNEFPFLFEFGWLINFFKTATAPCLSKVIVQSGHFTHRVPETAHARQQDTVCLMTAMQAQIFHSEFHALTMARINEHHNRYGNSINSDTVLWLSEMWMQGPIQWINLAGWRKLEAFEVHAMFVFWRELSLMLGCKWVPNTLEEFRKFRDDFVAVEQRPDNFNVLFSDAIMNSILYTVPVVFKLAARKCVIAVLDADVRHCNKYEGEFNPRLRSFVLGLLSFVFGTVQRHLCLPRVNGRVLTPTEANEDGTVNFPAYTFPNTPYYVKPTNWNQSGLLATISQLRGLPIPSATWGGLGVKWESMGAKVPNAVAQSRTEAKVRVQAALLAAQPWGYRAKVNFQKKSICVDQYNGDGYGSRENAYTAEELEKKGPTVMVPNGVIEVSAEE